MHIGGGFSHGQRGITRFQVVPSKARMSPGFPKIERHGSVWVPILPGGGIGGAVKMRGEPGLAEDIGGGGSELSPRLSRLSG